MSVGKNLLAALGRVAPQHTYLVTVPQGGGFEEVCEGLARCETVVWERPGLVRRWLNETFRLPKVIAGLKPDVILALADRGLVNPPCPQAILVHRPHLFYPPKHYGNETLRNRLLHWYHGRHLAKSLRRRTVLLCQTPVAERRLRETYGFTGRTVLVPNAVSAFTMDGASDQAMPEPLARYKDRMRLLCLTSYYAHKNLEVIVETFRRFPDELREVIVVTTVEARQHPKCPAFLRSIDRAGLMDRIVNVGPLPQTQLAAYYKNCHGMFLPTLLESFSGTYLEAMYFGVPILTSDLDFAHAVCSDAAIYFDPWDPGSIKDAILRLRNDPQSAQDMVARGRERLVTSCIYFVEEGLTVQTDTEKIRKIRRMLLELLLARCPDSEEIQDLAKQAGIEKTRFVEQSGNNKCILCANCARTCEEVVGVSAISLAKRGVERELTTPFGEDFSEVCIGCGSCSFNCPTGAITMEDVKGTRSIKWPHNSMEFKLKKCSVCGQYWAPEKQIEYVAKTSGTPLSDYDACPDCRD